MLVFLFILLSAGMFSLLKSYFDTYFIFKFIALTAFFVAIASISIIPVYVLRFCVLCLSKIVFNVNINGQVNLPVNKGAILALNHVSLLDALVVVSTFPRNVRFVVHQKVFDKPILGWVLRNLNMIPVNPGLGEKGLKDFTNRCIKTLNEGHVVCIFPEGQLSRNGKLGKFKKGIEFIADRTNAPIIPIHMEGLHGTPLSYKTGTDTCYKFSLKKLRSKVSVLVGSPIEGNFSVEYLYSVMKELEVNNINHLYANCFPVEAIKTIYNRLFQEEVKINNDYRIQPFIVPTPNYKISTLSRKNVELVGTKPSTLGQPIPGVAIRLVNDEGLKISNDKVGFIQIKHAFCKNPKWAFSGYKGSIDADGFVTIISK